MTHTIVALITTPSAATARKISLCLVRERVAACVNILPGVESIYIWKNKLCREREALMVVKTTASRFGKLMRRVKQLHPYTVPEIIALPVRAGSESYLKWVRGMTR